jgi:heme/copper-type cytochrome/quinol oxidase subunit 2
VFVTLVVAAATPLRGNRPRFFGHPHVDLGAVTFASIVVWAIAWPVMQIVFGAVYRRRERLAVVGLSMEEEGETGIAIVNAFVSVVVSGLLACADAAALSAGVVEASAGIALGIAVSMIVDRRERLRTGAIDRARHETGNGLRVETGASSNRLVLPSDREGTFRTSDRDAVLVTTLDPDGRATFGDLHAR